LTPNLRSVKRYGFLSYSDLILLTEVLFLAFALGGLGTNLFVILLKSGKIFTGLREFTFFHTFSDIPVDKGSLGVHEIELVVNTGKSFGNGSGVGNHAYSSLDTGKITTRNDSRWLVVNTALETSWAPVDELDSSLGLDGGDSRVDILRDDVTSEHHAASHELTVTWITLGKHVGWLKHSIGDFGHRKLLVVSLLSRDDRGIRGRHEVNSRVWDKVGLELSNINIKSTIETKGCCKGRYNLTNKSVKVGVGRSLNIKGSSAHVVKSLVIQAESTISMLKKGMGRKHVIVWLDDGSSNLRGRGDSERKLGLSTVINRKSLKKKRTKSRSTSTTSCVEDKETLKTGTVISQLSDSVKDKVNNFLSNGVVTTGVVVGGILLTRDQLLRVIQLSVGTSSDFIKRSRLKIKEDGSWDVLTGASFREEGVERIITTTNGLVGRHLTIRLNTVLKTVELPAAIAHLDTSLA